VKAEAERNECEIHHLMCVLLKKKDEIHSENSDDREK
jgi:hypothetical protein